MADPRPYAVSYDFSNQPIPLANEFANVATSVADLVLDVKQIRRADGKLRNKIVTLESLSIEVLQAIVTGTIPAVPGSADAITIAFSPGGNVVSTDVQHAIEELDAEKAPLAHTHTAISIAISTISNMVATNVQNALSELRDYGAVTGDLALTMNPSAPNGWLMLDDSSIGDASSGATHKSAAFQALFTVIYNSVSDTHAPVSTGRGPDAAADWAAHKSITLPKVLGRALAVAGQGAGLSSYAAGQANVGLEAVALQVSELPSHPHSVYLNEVAHKHSTPNLVTFGGGGNTTAGGGATVTYGATVDTSSVSTGVQVRSAAGGGGTQNVTDVNGGNGAHENRQPTAYWLARIKI